MKKCCSCKQDKVRDEFSKNVANKDGLQSECKLCQKAYRERNLRARPRKPYVNRTKPSVHEGAIMVKLINKRRWVTLDIEDFERFHDHKFYLNTNGYVYIRPDTKFTLVHKLIVDYVIVDHINQDPLDNRRANLRGVTRQQNQWNRKRSTRNTSGYKGVAWNKLAQKWIAKITINGRQKHLGCFDDVVEAARVYDKAATEHFGEYASLNFESDQL